MKFKNYIEVQSGIKDSANSPGTLDQVLTSTATGVAWVDPSTISAEAATLVVIECKNTSGATITKGTPVYQTGTVGATDVIEIAVADASDKNKMAAIGLLQTTLNNNGFGKVVITGELLNITTSPIDGVTPVTGDTIYVKPGGGLTLTKPTGVNFIQNVGLVGKVSSGNAGSITVSSIMRSNDVPTPLYIDHDNQRLGVGTTSPSEKLVVDGKIRSLGDTSSADFYSVGNDALLVNNGTSNMKFWNNGSERMRINSSGNVGIGTTTPTAPLHIEGGTNSEVLKIEADANPYIRWVQNGTNVGFLQFNGGSAYLSNMANGSLFFRTNNTDKMTILSGGNVGIGTTSPGAFLQVGGTTDSNGSPGSFNVAGSYGVDSWARTYVVSNTNVLSILQANNTALQNGGAYRVTGHIDSTGTDQSSRAVFWNQNGTWFCNVTGQSGASSNSISFLVDATTGLPSVKTYHANNYTVRVWHERINLNEGTGTDNSRHYFGADAYMTQIGNDISMFTTTYSGNNTTGKLGIGIVNASERLHVVGNARVTGAYYDSNNSPGTANQVLVSTVSGTDWVDGSGSSIIGGPYLPLTGGTLSGPGDLTVNGDVILGGSAQSPKTITIQQIGVTTTDTNAVMQDGNGVLKIRTLGTGAFGPTPVGNYLPLTAGSGSPLTGDLYIEGADKALRINNGTQPVVYLGDGGANTDGQLILYSSAGAANVLFSGDNQNHYIANGNVGIGTTSPNRLLDVDGIQGWSLNNAEVAYMNPTLTGADFLLKNSSGTGVIRLDGRPNANSYFNTGGNVGIGNTSPVNGKLVVTSGVDGPLNTVRIQHTRDDANLSTNALEIDMNLSGADTTTADRTNKGIHVDLDSSADGDASNEHRIHGIGSTVNFTGFSDIVRAGQFYAESSNITEKTAQLVGVFGQAIHDANSTDGGVSNMMGVYGYSQPQDLGDVDNAFGGYFLVNIGTNRGNADIGVTKGVEGEISIDKSSTINYGTMIGMSSVIDNNEGAVPNFGNQYLFKGDYQGTKGSNAWGIYTEGDKHYFDGKVGIGNTSPDEKLEVSGSGASDYPSIKITNPGQTGRYMRIGMIDSINHCIEANGGSTYLTFKTNATERMRIDTSGNVGIGTTSPSRRLEVSTSAYEVSKFAGNTNDGTGYVGAVLEIETNNDARGRGVYLTHREDTDTADSEWYAGVPYTGEGYSIGNAAYGTSINSATGPAHKNQSKIFIKENGDVGIGTTSPTSGRKLDVHGDIETTEDIFIGAASSTKSEHKIKIGQNRSNNGYAYIDMIGDAGAASNYNLRIIRHNSGANALSQIIHTGTGNFEIKASNGGDIILNSSGSIGISQTSPSYKLDVTGDGRFTSTVTATNFILSSDERLKENVEKVCDNRVKADWKTFELKTEKGQKRYGVIAQELEKTNPEFVREDSQGFKSVAYIDLLIAKIAELEARLEKLER